MGNFIEAKQMIKIKIKLLLNIVVYDICRKVNNSNISNKTSFLCQSTTKMNMRSSKTKSINKSTSR